MTQPSEAPKTVEAVEEPKDEEEEAKREEILQSSKKLEDQRRNEPRPVEARARREEPKVEDLMEEATSGRTPPSEEKRTKNWMRVQRKATRRREQPELPVREEAEASRPACAAEETVFRVFSSRSTPA